MPSEPTGPTAVSERRDSLLTLALWAGFVTGFAEVAALGTRIVGPRFCACSRDALWMIPAFDAALFGLIGLGLLAVSRVVRVPWRVAAGILAGLGASLVLVHLPRIHELARAVLAIGVGVQAMRLLAPRVPAAARGVRRSLPWLAVSVGVVAALTMGWRTVRERSLVRSRPIAMRDAPNVLLLILDTVRAASLSLYGYARPTTPELERFAERATVFDRAFAAASWTLPSHASMFTGRWPFELEADWEHPLGPRWPLLAEVLRSRGYATAAFAANDLYVNWESGLARGFERFDDFPVSLWTATEATGFGRAVYPRLRQRLTPLLSRVPVLWRLQLPPRAQHRSAAAIADAFLGWVDHDRPEPFFAFLNFMDAHWPYTAPDSFRFRFRSTSHRTPRPQAWRDTPTVPLTPADVRPKQDVYDGSIAYLDSQLGRLFRELDRRGLLENTLVIVAADHGDEYAEHQLVDHGKSLYRLSLHVPLVVWFPGHVPEGRRVTAPVSLRNLAATVLDLLHTRGTSLPGRSLARFWNGAGASPDTIVASVRQMENQPAWYPSARGDLFSIGIDGWRYIRNGGDAGEELYDFEHDLLERWNLVGTPEGDRKLPHYQAALGALLAATPEARFAKR